MKTLNSPVKFMVYSVLKALRHPRTPISYFVCGCGCRFPNSAKACPKCGDKVEHSPDHKQDSPIPWYGCVTLIIVGALIWAWSAACDIVAIAELGRILVYIPIGHLFGLSLKGG